MRVPYFSVIFIVAVQLVTNPLYSSASSHWVVTEEGKIQAQVDSIFSMKRPYDLVALMQQEERAEILNQLKEEMSSKKFDETISHVVEQTSTNQDDANWQKKFFETNTNCKKAKIPLSEFDLYSSTTLQPEFHLEDLLRRYQEESFDDEDDDYDYEDDDDKPYCKSLDSSTDIAKFISKLIVYANRQNIKIIPEEGLANSLSINKPGKLARYSKAIKKFLQKGRQNWIANFYAANYWRISGSAKESIQCLRNAIVFSPDDSKYLGLLALANICHRTHHPDEAIIVLQRALQYTPDQATLYFTLGNVYATSMMFNESAASYHKALEIRPKYQAAKVRRYAVLCHENLERTLQKQHTSLQETLEELRIYKKQHDAWASLLTKILNEQASTETRSEIQRAYDLLKIQMNNRLDKRNEKLSKRPISKEAEKQETINRLVRMFEKKIESSGMFEHSDRKDEDDTAVEKVKEDVLVPTLRAKYQSWPTLKSDPNLPDLSSDECATLLARAPKESEYPTVFVSPENRGFDLAEMFSVLVGIPQEHPAALPWYPPLCKSYNRPIPKYNRLKSFEKIRKLEVETRSTSEKDVEIEYSLHSPANSFHEWGARINAALKEKTAIPDWITYVLAGTYWRIWGHPQNGLDCFKNALAQVPKKYLDVVLTNLAGMLYKTGGIDDAVTVLKDAIAISDKEPGTNFFLANMFAIKGNLSGSIYHYKQVLKMIPDHRDARELIQIPLCQAKFNLLAKADQQRDADDSCKNNLSSECLNRNKITKLPGIDGMIYCQDDHCKFVQSSDGLLDSTDDFTIEDVKSTKSVNMKKSVGKKKKSTNKQLKETREESFQFPEDDILEPTTTTLLMARDDMKKGLPQGAVEIGTIAETESDEEEVEDESRLDSERAVLMGPTFLQDDPLPDVLVSVRPETSTVDLSGVGCDDESVKNVNWQAFTSTWLSSSAKGIDIREYLGDYLEPLKPSQYLKPVCEQNIPTTMNTFDHLTGVKHRKRLHLASEAGLKEAFLGLLGSRDHHQTVEETATRIASALKTNQTSWVLNTAAALYWRVKGNSEQAIECLRNSLQHTPREMKDIPLISLANILHRAGLYNDALIAANMALEISPNFVVVHFTIANIYASMMEYQKAEQFYMSTLTLQSTFDPARDRLLSLGCNGKLSTLSVPKEEL